MFHSHKKHNWTATHTDGRTATVLASSFYFAREMACAVLECERENIRDIRENEEKKVSP